jgi:hypothetical protein
VRRAREGVYFGLGRRVARRQTRRREHHTRCHPPHPILVQKRHSRLKGSRPRHVTLLLYGAKIHPEQSCIAAGTLESLFLILHTARERERERGRKREKEYTARDAQAGDITQKSNSLSWPTYIFSSFFMHPVLCNLYTGATRRAQFFF